MNAPSAIPIVTGFELASSPERFRASVAALPYSSSRVEGYMPAGSSVLELLEHFGVSLDHLIVVKINGLPLARPYWPHVRPKPGVLVTIRALPQGGDDSNPLATVFSIGLAILAPIAGGALAGGLFGLRAGTMAFSIVQGVTAGLIGIAGRALVSGLVDSPEPRLGSVDNGFNHDPQKFGISGIRNTFPAPSQPVLSIFGRMRVFPFFATQPYAWVKSNEQYLSVYFDFGYGPLQFDMSTARIGDRPLREFTGVKYWTKDGTPGFTSSVGGFKSIANHQPMNVTLDKADGWRTFTTPPDTDEVHLDVTFPGLIEFDDQGNKVVRTVSFEVARRENATGPWLSDDIEGLSGAVDSRPLVFPNGLAFGNGGFQVSGSEGTSRTANISVRSQSTATKFTTIEFKFDNPGQHQVRIRRRTADTTDSKIRDKAFIAALTSFTYARPVQARGRAGVVLQLQASGELNGIVDTFSVEVTRGVRKYNGSSWDTSYSYGTDASNPAWVFAEIMRGQGVPADVRAKFTDSKLNGSELATWASFCTSGGFTFNGVVDGRDGLWSLLKDVAGTGRASPIIQDGDTLSVIIDQAQVTPVDIITPRTALEYRGRRSFEAVPHALRCRFRDAANNYELSEIVVYRDSYTASTATDIRVQEFWGKTNESEVYYQALYLLAAMKLRRERHDVTMDVQHIAFTRGDYVELCHDVPLVGLGQARVLSVTPASGDVTGITVDSPLTMEAGKSYVARFQMFDGTRVLANIVTSAGAQTALSFSPVIPAATRPEEDMLVAFGESGVEFLDCVVDSIRAFNDHSAQVSLLPLANAIHDVDSAALPDFDPKIVRPAELSPPIIEPPRIRSIITNEDAALIEPGIAQERIAVELRAPRGFDTSDAQIHAQVKLTTDTEWQDVPLQNVTSLVAYITGVEAGKRYDFRLRYVTVGSYFPGLTSKWVRRTVTVVGGTAPPPEPSNFRIEGDTLRWSYLSPPRDFKGFDLRWRRGISSNHRGATKLHDDVLLGNSYRIAGLTRRRSSFILRAVDQFGNFSTATTIFVNVSNTEFRNIIETRDVAAEPYPYARNEISGLTQDDTLEPLDVDIPLTGGNIDVTDDAVFSCRITVPAAGAEGVLFAAGAVTTPYCAVVFHDGRLTFRTGEREIFETSTLDLTQDIKLDIELSDVAPAMLGQTGVLSWEYRVNPGRIRVFWQGHLIGTASTSLDGAMRGSAWSSTLTTAGGYGAQGALQDATGDLPNTPFNGELLSVLEYYGGELISNLVDNNLIGGTLTGGNLVADSDGDRYLPYDGEPYLPDASAAYLPVTYLPMEYTFAHIPDTAHTGAELEIDETVEGNGYELQYRARGSSIYLPLDDVDYLPDLNAAYLESTDEFVAWSGPITAQRQRYDFRLTLAAGSRLSRVTALRVITDALDIEELIEDVVISASGTRLPITLNYREIVQISADIQDDGNGARSIVVVDKSATLGPLVQAYNSADTAVAARSTFRVRGF